MAVAQAALTERTYVGQFGSPTFGLRLVKGGVEVDADTIPTVTLTKEGDPDEEIATLNTEVIDTGVYEVSLTSVHTQEPGYYTLTWNYTFDGYPETFAAYIEVGPANPAYDELPEGFKDLVDNVWLRFADGYDSPNGGPHAQVELQTHFTRGRFGQLLRHALNALNVKAQPRTTYVIPPDQGKEFPLGKWGGMLEQALYIEALKHLRRTYTEQPEVVGVNVARLDRRDYVRRWGDILQDEMRGFEESLEHFKIAHMGLGRPAIIVSGGAYGTYAPTRVSHAGAARPRYWARYY